MQLQQIERGSGRVTRKQSALWQRVSVLGGASAFLVYLAEAGSDRLTLAQATFFMLAAAADARGRPVTSQEVQEMAGDALTRSIKNTYRLLLEPNRRYPHALGWLATESNPDDERQKFLRLTDAGKAVLNAALVALEPLERGVEAGHA